MISALVVGDSITKFRHRITSLIIVIPRIVLAELNTHRAISKNSASSRAIPYKRMVHMVKTNPFIPIAWQKEHKGMQGTEYHEGFKVRLFRFIWIFASRVAIFLSGLLTRWGATKQLANRMLEPFMWHTVMITATEWENFFTLRCPQYVTPVGGRDEDGNPWIYRSKEDVYEGHSNEENHKLMDSFSLLDWMKLNKGQAEIHIMAVAEAIWDAMNESNPDLLHEGEWHIPFRKSMDVGKLHEYYNSQPVPEGSMVAYEIETLVKVSTGMSARTSYTVVGDEKDISYLTLAGIHDKMLKSQPFHASPFEHCAQAGGKDERSGNFVGWKQYRKILAEKGEILEY